VLRNAKRFIHATVMGKFKKEKINRVQTRAPTGHDATFGQDTALRQNKTWSPDTMTKTGRNRKAK